MLEKAQSIGAEKAFLVGLYTREDIDEPELSLNELASLTEAAGGVVVGRLYQRRAGRDGTPEAINPATYIGRGKAEHVGNLASDLEAKVVVFDNELSPAQIRELEKIVGCKVIDRSELILDIFANRARSRASKLQVELAQLQYTAPRLRGMWTHLERQAGTGGASMAIGMRGPGEKQIEIDRRIVDQRISKLRNELARLHKRKEREVKVRNSKAFTVGLVGYTNAGKSTLMNALTDADAYTADKLFATLDTKTRRWAVGPGTEIALSDTVGFVRKLPHHLVASFRSTLEEALNADLLLHIIDASHPQALSQVETVERVLADLDCDLSRVVPVLNKIDNLLDEDAVVHLRSRLSFSVSVSALTGQGLDELVKAVANRRRQEWLELRIEAPAGNGRVQALVRSRGLIKHERFDGDRWIADIEMPRASVPALRQESGVSVEEL